MVRNRARARAGADRALQLFNVAFAALPFLIFSADPASFDTGPAHSGLLDFY